ncbi:hypothetical protein B0H19DRAFT_117620 [Mycena capillaripes]|nr:hypothetical protein B0H19DRAFT_117620 [Mycena capillaripes]
MLLWLPVEILQEIGLQIPTAEKKSLRCVCKELALAMDCVIFTTIILNTLGLRLVDGTTQNRSGQTLAPEKNMTL